MKAEPIFCDYRRIPPLCECAQKVRFPVEAAPAEPLTFVLVDVWGNRYEQPVQGSAPYGAVVDLEGFPPGLLNPYAGEFRAWFVAGAAPNEELRAITFESEPWKAMMLSFASCTADLPETINL